MQDYPSIYSVNQLLTTIGVAAGPILVGLLRDVMGNYTIPLLAATVISAVAAVTLALTPDSHRSSL